ncbi:GNAT family N-acetyltransferase [Paenibacillus lautus]|uniref:GNAT family N-acetyltransferase n=1 Tax=Paenibacillus lautus TaxID=1401 RepID=UPI002DBB17D9|nr:GNAT family N-acetyltransferase [Paenibacillus lautus]MEC0201549.1 GNAT family N-acetyltransferase [Paenibacillus lautus]
MNINIRTGRIEDLQEIMALIARCVSVMQAGGSDQWDDQYPNREIIGEDLQRGTLFAAEGEGRILGIIVLDESQAAQYQTINWKQEDGPHLMMHRLAVDPEAQGQGVARKLIAFSEEYAMREGYTSLRLDTYAKNTAALRLYQGLGYDLRGEVKFPGRAASFPVFEKVLG